MALRPLAAAGEYDGSLAIRQIRVVDAPVLAGLLDAISVVGLLGQLNGPGCLFNDVSGQFRLTPSAVEIRDGSAVGPSLGISAAGTYQDGRRADRPAGRDLADLSPQRHRPDLLATPRGAVRLQLPPDRGTPPTPQVSVNPLSILTPGMFREIFRRPTADLTVN